MAGGQERRRILAAPGPPLSVVGLAARGVRWSSLFAIGISVLLFANCSAGVSSGTSASTAGGASADPAAFWPLVALVMLPLVLALALPAALATAAQRFAVQGRLNQVTRAGSLGMWSAGLITLMAVVTTAIAFYGGISYCFSGTSPGACAAGAGGMMNPTAIGSLLLIMPYLALMNRVLRARSDRS